MVETLAKCPNLGHNQNMNPHIEKIINEVGTQKDLSKRLGISYSYMRNIKSGESKVPPKLVKKLAALSNGKVTERQLRPDIF